jgi:hypothetical protein
VLGPRQRMRTPVPCSSPDRHRPQRKRRASGAPFGCEAVGSITAAFPLRRRRRCAAINPLRFRAAPRMRPDRAVLPALRRGCPA